MADEILIPEVASKAERYEALSPQIKTLIQKDVDDVANMANVAAAIKETFGFFWIGFYRVINDQLVLGPFQGPVACTTIPKGKGVCGTTWQEEKTIIVKNVDEYENHIACSPHSKSEIVVPVFKDNKVVGVLDIDHDQYDTFDETDQKYLEAIVAYL